MTPHGVALLAAGLALAALAFLLSAGFCRLAVRRRLPFGLVTFLWRAAVGRRAVPITGELAILA